MKLLFYVVLCVFVAAVTAGPTNPVSCGEPGIVPNGKATPVCQTQGCLAKVECNQDFKLVGEADIKCQTNGTWTAMPTCARSCGEPSNVPNGKVTPGCQTQGCLAKVECNQDFKLVGEADIKCQTNGTWTAMPTCVQPIAPNATTTAKPNNGPALRGGSLNFYLGMLVIISAVTFFN